MMLTGVIAEVVSFGHTDNTALGRTVNTPDHWGFNRATDGGCPLPVWLTETVLSASVEYEVDGTTAGLLPVNLSYSAD